MTEKNNWSDKEEKIFVRILVDCKRDMSWNERSNSKNNWIATKNYLNATASFNVIGDYI